MPKRPRLSALARFRPGRPSPADLGRVTGALLLGLLCGAAAAWVRSPLPWMLGPMVGCAIAAFAGAPLRAPRALRTLAVPVLGVLLGSGFHPGMAAQIVTWTDTLLLLPPFLVLAGLASYAVFRGIGGYDHVTAFYSAAPGGLNEMILLGAAAGGDETRIALAHALRISVTVAVVAVGVALFFQVSSGGGGRRFVGIGDMSARDLGALVLCALAGPWLGWRLRLPAPQLFGPLLLSASGHLSGLVTAAPPTLVVIAAQLAIGTTLGCRFVGASLRKTGRDIALAVLATLAMLVVTFLFAALVSLLGDTPVTEALLAFSPGGLAEMSLLALALGGDVAYVATLHLARIVLVLLSVPLLKRWV